MTAVGETNSPLMTQCLDFCQALALQGTMFKFSVTIGSNFTFSLDTREGKDVPVAKIKKRSSPSTMRRNARRREEFLNKKSPSEAAVATGLETNQKLDDSFLCDQCESTFKTESGSKIHKGKTHKKVPSPEKMRKSTSQSSLTVSPIRDESRVEPCQNCGMDMSPTHQCLSDQDLILDDRIEITVPPCPAALKGRQDCGCTKWGQPCLYRTPDFMQKYVPKK